MDSTTAAANKGTVREDSKLSTLVLDEEHCDEASWTSDKEECSTLHHDDSITDRRAHDSTVTNGGCARRYTKEIHPL